MIPMLVLANRNTIRGDVDDGYVTGLRGDVTGLRGDVTGLRGDVTGLRGYVTGLRGYVTGLRGDVTGLRGDVDDCELTGAERSSGVDIKNLIQPEGTNE
jgi:hypothetical protein